MEYRDSVVVCENHLDTNEHMNNGEYIRIACNYLPQHYEVADLRVEYRLAAKLGETIELYTKQVDESFYVVMTDKEKAPFAIICLKERK